MKTKAWKTWLFWFVILIEVTFLTNYQFKRLVERDKKFEMVNHDG
jgi:hypothetical protein